MPTAGLAAGPGCLLCNMGAVQWVPPSCVGLFSCLHTHPIDCRPYLPAQHHLFNKLKWWCVACSRPCIAAP